MESLITSLTPDKFWSMYLKQSREMEKISQKYKELLAAYESCYKENKSLKEKAVDDQQKIELLQKQLRESELKIKTLEAENEIHCAKLVAQEDTMIKLSKTALQSALPAVEEKLPAPEQQENKTEKMSKQMKFQNIVSTNNICECVSQMRALEVRLGQLGYDLRAMMAQELLSTMQEYHPFSSIEALNQKMASLEIKIHDELGFLAEDWEEEEDEEVEK